MREMILRIKKDSKLIKNLFVLVTMSVLLISGMHIYNDILITAKHGKMVWDLLFSGKLLQFYSNSTVITGNDYYPLPQTAAYPFMYYVIFAIFELPLWIFEKVSGFNLYNTYFGNLYSKFILLIAIFISMLFFGKVLKELNKTDKEINIYLLIYLSSIVLISSTCITSQYDIFNVLFFNLGFYYWLKKDIKHFILVFSISINLKYFSLMYFAILLLIEEKRVSKLIWKGFLAMLPTVILTAIFALNDSVITGKNISTGYLKKFIIINDIYIGNHPVSSFLLLSIIACAIAYFYQYKNEKERRQIAVFTLLLVIGGFCLIPDSFAYWTVLGVPIFVLSVAVSNGNDNKMLFFETVLGASLTVYQYYFYNWMFCAMTTSAMGVLPAIFDKHPDVTNKYGPDTIIMSMGLNTDHIYLIYTLAYAAWFLMLYYTFPKHSEETDYINDKMLIFRTIINIGLMIFPLVSAIYIYFRYY